MRKIKRGNGFRKMASKKTFVDELKKYNKELEVHIPNLNFDFLKSENFFNDEQDYKSDVSSLIASNLIDLKTELSLVRRNLSDTIEGMVMRSLAEQQSQFAKFVDDFYKKMTLSFKGTISSFEEELGTEFSKMRKDVEKISLSGKLLSDKLDLFGTDLLEFRSVLTGLDDFKDDAKIMLDNKFELIDERLAGIKGEFVAGLNSSKYESDKISKIILSQKDSVDRALKDLSSKYSALRNENLEVNKSILGIGSNFENLKSDIKKINTNEVGIKEEILGFKHSLSDIDRKDVHLSSRVKSSHQVMSDLKKVKVENKTRDIANVVATCDSVVSGREDFTFNSNSAIDKLISLDNRLKKLNALR